MLPPRKPAASPAAALLLLALLPVGCARHAAPTDDASLTAAVQSRLAADSALGSGPIQASVQGGVATLSGNVSSDAARVLAANDTAQVAGVRTVVNNLSVQPPVPLPPQTAAVPTPAPLPPRIAPAPALTRRDRDRKQAARAKVPAPAGDSAAAPPPDPTQAQSLQPPAPVVTAPPPPKPVPTFREVTLPAGSVLPVRITQTLDSATTQQGQTFSGTIASDVLADGATVIAQGSSVSGRVDAVQEAAHFKGNALLTISLTSVARKGGDSIAVATEGFSKEGNGRGKNTAEKVGGGAAVGAILGGIFGGGKGAGIGAAAGGGLGAGANGVTRGQQVQIPSETLVRFRLSNPITVRIRADATEDSGSARRPLE